MSTNRAKPIIVGYDFSELAEAALDRALTIATSTPNADLHVIAALEGRRAVDALRVEDSSPLSGVKADFSSTEGQLEALNRAVQSRLDRLPSGEWRVFTHVRIGHPVDEILELAGETGAGLILVGTHGRKGASRLLLGSVAEKLVRKAACSVLVVRPEADTAQLIEEGLQPEPPCPQCLAVRESSNGATWWCEEHAQKRMQPHVFRYGRPNPTVGSYYRFD